MRGQSLVLRREPDLLGGVRTGRGTGAGSGLAECARVFVSRTYVRITNIAASMVCMQQRSSVAVDRETVLDLNQIAIDLAHSERRPVTLGEVIRRLIDAWRQQAAAGEDGTW